MDQHISDFMKLDDEFEAFIHNCVNTFVKWELVQFFYNHAEQGYTLEDLTQKLNRSSKTLHAELSELVDNNLLTMLDETKKNYHLINNKATLDLLDRFIKFCKTREGRLRVIYKILKDGKRINN